MSDDPGRKFAGARFPATIAVLIIATFVPLTAADWLHFGYDDQYSSHNRWETKITTQNVKQLKRVWGVGCDDGWFSVIWRSPAIYDNVMYTSGAGERLRAYDVGTGALLWEFGEGNLGWAPQPVVSQDGVIFYLEGAFPTNLYAVRRDTGQMIWKAPLGFELGYTGAVEAVVTIDEQRGVVYVVEDQFIGDDKLYALNKKTGKILWYKSKSKDKVAIKGDYVLLRNASIFAVATVTESWYEVDKMACINAQSKKIERYYTRPQLEQGWQISGYSLCKETLIVVYSDRDDQFCKESVVAAYSIKSPNVLWQKSFPSSGVTGAIACNTLTNTLYVPTDPYLYALNAKTGAQIWRYTGFGPIFSPTLANGILYFLSDNNMYAISEKDKKRLFSYSLGYEADYTTQVAVCNGRVYFSGNGGTCDLFVLALPDSSAPDSEPDLP